MADGLPANVVTALAQDTTGYLWVGTMGGGLARFDGETFLTYTTADGLADNFVVALRVGPGGELYALTRTGTAVLRPGQPTFEGAAAGAVTVGPQTITPPPSLALSPLAGTRVRALITDRQNRQWVGTDGGLARLIPTGIRRYARGEAGLARDKITALLAAGDGTLWVGADRNGLQRLDTTDFRSPLPADPTRGHPITGITRDDGGNIYVATAGNGVTVLDDTLGVTQLDFRSGLPDDRLLRVLPADSGRVWAVSYDQGVGRIARGDSAFAVTYFGADRGVPLTNFTAALSLPTGGLLLADRLGNLYDWAPDRRTLTYGRANGLPAAPVTALALRRQTQLWVAIAGYGLFHTDLRQQPLRFVPPPRRLGGMPANIRQILAPDGSNEVWLGTDRDLVRLTLDVNGRPDWLRTYGRAEGFPVGESLSATAAAGRLWFGTNRGLVSLLPDGTDGYLAPPPTVLTGTDLFYAPLPQSRLSAGGPLTLPADSNHLNFRFRAVDLSHPERVRYQWRLAGLETDWSPAVQETSVRYAGLAPGRYGFRVRATTDGGKTWGAAAAVDFAIAVPRWRSGWVQGGLTLLVTGLLVGGSYLFYRRLQRSEARKRTALEAQNQLLSLEQKALQLQMNPHFIFNALNGIRGLVDGSHDREARQQISRFAKLMRGILNNSRRERISLAEEIATLTDYLEMERFCQPFDFDYAINPPAGVDPEEVSLPSMLLQPFLENAVLHGLAGLDRPGRITVTFTMRGRRMQCTVEDNGRGRAAAAARKAGRTTAHRSVALEVTRQRLQTLNGHLSIVDLTTAAGQPAGTRVEMVIPADSW